MGLAGSVTRWGTASPAAAAAAPNTHLWPSLCCSQRASPARPSLCCTTLAWCAQHACLPVPHPCRPLAPSHALQTLAALAQAYELAGACNQASCSWQPAHKLDCCFLPRVCWPMHRQPPPSIADLPGHPAPLPLQLTPLQEETVTERERRNSANFQAITRAVQLRYINMAV